VNEAKEDPNAAHDKRWKDLMELSRRIALQRLAAGREAQAPQEQETDDETMEEALREVDPYYFPRPQQEVQKAAPAEPDGLRALVDLLRQILERPQVAPQVVVNMPPEIVARLAPFKTTTVVQRNERGGLLGSTSETVPS
jgi:hypothetical protein